MVRIKEVTTEDEILDLYTVFPNENQNFFFEISVKNLHAWIFYYQTHLGSYVVLVF